MSYDIEHYPDDECTLHANWPEVHSSVMWFSGEMLAKFERVQHKGHWFCVDWSYLYQRVHDEMAELIQAVDDPELSPEDIIAECVDVANAALMLADWWRRYHGDMPA